MNLPMSKSGVELKTTVEITRFSDASTADYSPNLSCLLEDRQRDRGQSFKSVVGPFKLYQPETEEAMSETEEEGHGEEE